MSAYLYVLIDPFTNEVRYVGITTNQPKFRLQEHCNHPHSLAIALWVQELKLRGALPKMDVIMHLERRKPEAIRMLERRFVRSYTQQGAKLLNAEAVYFLPREKRREPAPPQPEVIYLPISKECLEKIQSANHENPLKHLSELVESAYAGEQN